MSLQIENTEKRDLLRGQEIQYQKLWQDSAIYEQDAPKSDEKPPKWFGTMAYPYVNGTPHLGHAFTITKVDFAARHNRAAGRRVCYPQGYHCTGMPIKASADKLVNELRKWGKPTFEGCTVEALSALDDETKSQPSQPAAAAVKTDVTKFSNEKKGKAALKSGPKTTYQFQVMLAIGVPIEEIHKFAVPDHWLRYFPQLWQKHLIEFGASVDWRRSFVTTDANPYYDSFVRWQMRKLKDLDRIRFGKRYTVYSPKDQQACLDHDRASGEGINVQEYTALKCKVKTWSPEAQKALEGKLPSDANVYMVPATLRPETMYGQSNMFVSPKINYGIFKVTDKEYYFVTKRAARNMAFQGVFPTWAEIPEPTVSILGSDVIGTLINAPLSQLGEIYIVPMDTIKEGKGTGVVTSVPSDSPDDYVMNRDLAKKPDFYHIKAEWIPTTHLPIIETPSYGKLTAEFLVNKMKINSPKDAKQLAEAKEEAYKEGFYKGKMIYGEFSGKSVQEAKELVKQALVKSGDAFAYAEPDGEVISRSGDVCVAAHLDQWFLTYGDADPEWREEVLAHVAGEDGQNFNTFTSTTKNALQTTLGWMNQWAVTRQFGLGTKLPWDESQLVESLSDSTIYMAYYTIAHYLHKDIYGVTPGLANVKAAQMTDEVWEYIFGLGSKPKSDIPTTSLDEMRAEFSYWYPLDVRISGKDLINNHLIFFLYIHQAIWGKKRPDLLPRGIRINGHAMLNGEKMSKSTGNFLTLDDAVHKYGADATRVALADAGDGVEDANFEETVANSTILRLFELRKWIEEVTLEARLLKDSETYAGVRDTEKIRNADVIQRTGSKGFWDELFDNEMNDLVAKTVEEYGATNYKLALQFGYHEFTAARDSYRVSTTSAALGMHHDCVKRYVELQAQMIAVIAPHWADYIWQEVLKKPSSITTAHYPTVPAQVASLKAASDYVRSTSSAIGSAEGAQQKKAAKGKNTTYDPKKEKKLTIFVGSSFPEWQTKYINLAREAFDGKTFEPKKLLPKVDKKDIKKVMAFYGALKQKLDGGESAEGTFDRKLQFDEKKVLEEMVPGLKVTVLRLKEVEIVVVEEGKEGLPAAAALAEPGAPSFEFVNVESVAVR